MILSVSLREKRKADRAASTKLGLGTRCLRYFLFGRVVCTLTSVSIKYYSENREVEQKKKK